MNITDRFANMARTPGQVAYVGQPNRMQVSYAALDRLIDAAALRVLEAGVRPGQTAIVGLNEVFPYIVTMLALARIGVAAGATSLPDRFADVRLVSAATAGSTLREVVREPRLVRHRGGDPGGGAAPFRAGRGRNLGDLRHVGHDRHAAALRHQPRDARPAPRDCGAHDADTGRAAAAGQGGPADELRLPPAGRLVIAGRQDEMVNVGGDKLSPRVIEERVRALGNVVDAAVFTVPNARGIPEVWVAVVPGPSLDVGAFATRCAEAKAVPLGTRFLSVPEVPRNPAGKVLRDDLVRMVVARRGG